jgi:hypothetical protein
LVKPLLNFSKGAGSKTKVRKTKYIFTFFQQNGQNNTEIQTYEYLRTVANLIQRIFANNLKSFFFLPTTTNLEHYSIQNYKFISCATWSGNLVSHPQLKLDGLRMSEEKVMREVPGHMKYQEIKKIR